MVIAARSEPESFVGFPYLGLFQQEKPTFFVPFRVGWGIVCKFGAGQQKAAASEHRPAHGETHFECGMDTVEADV